MLKRLIIFLFTILITIVALFNIIFSVHLFPDSFVYFTLAYWAFSLILLWGTYRFHQRKNKPFSHSVAIGLIGIGIGILPILIVLMAHI